MTITAEVIKDSIHHTRLTTLQLRYPRWIHSEFMTHRMFSRNASSSRAIPVKRLIEDIQRDPAMPIHWGRNQPGMQAREEHNAPVMVPQVVGVESFSREDAWLEAMDHAIMLANCFDRAGYHKQIVNRLLEPFSHINVLVTATEWENFFLLRDHPDAQPEIRELAQVMKQAMNESEPEWVHDLAWHLPYITAHERLSIEPESTLVFLSAARCARVSYLTHDGKRPTLEDDLKLFQKLLNAVPAHLSPLEHQAHPQEGRHANFIGWKQARD